ITQMDEMTQQNAALVEQAAAAAESMEEQAQALAQAVSVFKLTSASNTPPAKSIRVNPVVQKKDLKPKLKQIASRAESSVSTGKSAKKENTDDWEEF
ncbi:methyl-accepting chemotaxis protein, partial [Undibacterium sp. 10I3]|nr:methyl-accepting chemotaxis protein [Undibacterium sp. 10I3]